MKNPKRQLKIFYLYRTPRSRLLKDYLQNKSPSTFLYGLAELRNFKYQAVFSDQAYSRFNLLKYIRFITDRLLLLLLRYPLGFMWDQILINFRRISSSDIVVATQDSCGLPLLFFRKIGFFPHCKIIYMSNNLAPLLNKNKSGRLNKYLKSLLKTADIRVCFSESDRRQLQHMLDLEFHNIGFGTDIHFFTPERHQPYEYDLVAPGNDRGRDFMTLMHAVKNTSWKTLIVTDLIKSKTASPSNVSIMSPVNPSVLRHIYARSRICVIPLKSSRKTQGQAVMYEALAMGKPVIVSAVPGIFSRKKEAYAQLIRVRPGSCTDLRKMIRLQMNKRKKIYTVNRQAISMEKFTENLMSVV